MREWIFRILDVLLRAGGVAVAGARAVWNQPVVYLTVLLALMAAGGVLGFLISVSGVVPIKASSKHWAITQWFLDFSSRRSVATHVWGLKAPPLDRPELVIQGAGAYESNCRFCHGSPSMPNPRGPAQAMTPPPPYLSPVMSEWEDVELFYIVKHGIKFTGMPAWPSQQRDDEVWSMVAFLRTLPELDAEEYRRLAGAGNASSSETAPRNVPLAVSVSCARCHGIDGLGRDGAFPRLAGQNSGYLSLSLQAFAGGERHSGVMAPIAAALSNEQMTAIATYYSKLPGPSAPSPTEETRLAIQRGETIAQQGIPNQRVPSCAECHGPGDTPRNSAYPEHAGQPADYLVLQLELFKRKQRGGTAYAHLMDPVVAGLTPEQMRDVALYYASLDSRSDSRRGR